MWVIDLHAWSTVHVASLIFVASSIQSKPISADCDPPIRSRPLINHIWRLLCVSMFMPLILGFSLFSLVFCLPIVLFRHSEGSWHVIVLIFEWSLNKFWRLRECFGFIFGPFANKANSPHNVLDNASSHLYIFINKRNKYQFGKINYITKKISHLSSLQMLFPKCLWYQERNHNFSHTHKICFSIRFHTRIHHTNIVHMRSNRF